MTKGALPMTGPKRKTAAAAVLTAVAVLIMLRSLLVGLEIDEEYALSLGYRLVSGDRLFYSMWEPHQLSALPAAVLVALFLAVTGGTGGILLFVRAVMLAAKAVLSLVFYREMRSPLGRTHAWLLALGLFLYTPKWFLGPDYISQQFHFAVAAFLCFYPYYAGGCRRVRYIVPGAVFACLSFLAFPQSIPSAAVIAVGMAVLGARRGEARLLGIPRGAVVFVLSCAGCAAAFLAWVLPGMGLGMLLERVGLILHDPQYSFSAAERLSTLAGQAVTVARFLALPLLLAAAAALLLRLRRRTDDPVGAFLAWAGVLSTLKCTLRMFTDSNADMRQFLPVLLLAGAWAFRRSRGTVREPLFWLGFLPGVVAYLFILRSTLLGLAPTFMYLTWPVFCGLAAMLSRAPAGRIAGRACLGALLLFLAATRLWCVLITGWGPANFRDTPLCRIESGPAAGIWADTEAADMQDALREALEPYAGQKVLQAIGLMHGLGFLEDDGTLEVAQSTVISGTDSDPRLIQYYTELPEKLPDVILYDCNEVRDMAAFHQWIETNLPIRERYPVRCGTAELEVLVVDSGASLDSSGAV